ncbi:hypothetical protein [Pleurocapsa sp. PCC 7319]|uniref:hypothetical protein n=1 Tax=Pleurocapsa sp. PCC 7319 TaxID=118161 RepID=UPI000346BCDB|nr:hypothetical protein [Pleurocapsa sp. PCC 7319]
MKRPSSLIFRFVLAIATIFLAYALSRILFRIVTPPEIEIEEDIESQRYKPQAVTLKL